MSDTQGSVEAYQFAVTGALTVLAGAVAYPVPFNAELVSVYAQVGTAPTGADLLLNVRKNGVALFSGTGRVKVAAGSTSGKLAEVNPVASGQNYIGGAVPNTPALGLYSAGDSVSVDVEQIGSTVAGSNLGVTLFFVER